MKKIILSFLVFGFISFSVLNAQTVCHQRAASIQKGMNISNWLEAHWLKNIPGQPYPVTDWFKKSDLAFMKEMGFKTVRLPVMFERLTDTVSPYQMDTCHLAFSFIDSAIVWSQDLGLNLIFDNHHGYVLDDSNCWAAIPRLATMWKQIVQRYDYLDPDHVFFELKNEVEGSINQSYLQIVQQAIIDTIRKYNTTHTIIAGSNYWNSGYSLMASQPYSDTNIIYTFHFYEPFNFTHQGFIWAGYTQTGIPFPATTTEQTTIRDLFVDVNSWAETNNVPIFLGEFGTGIHADTVSRCNWIEFINHLCDSLQIPWVYWDWEYDFSMFKNRIMVEDSMFQCFKDAINLMDTTFVAIVEKPLETQTDIYPNPATQDVYIDSDKEIKKIYVFNNIGQNIATHYHAPINVKAYKQGMYYFKILYKSGEEEVLKWIKN